MAGRYGREVAAPCSVRSRLHWGGPCAPPPLQPRLPCSPAPARSHRQGALSASSARASPFECVPPPHTHTRSVGHAIGILFFSLLCPLTYPFLKVLSTYILIFMALMIFYPVSSLKIPPPVITTTLMSIISLLLLRAVIHYVLCSLTHPCMCASCRSYGTVFLEFIPSVHTAVLKGINISVILYIYFPKGGIDLLCHKECSHPTPRLLSTILLERRGVEKSEGKGPVSSDLECDGLSLSSFSARPAPQPAAATRSLRRKTSRG